ncbi:hypothetical protein GCM10009069_06420 [Algimonas arctica]|uniref:Uncharacterized protein n=1 Tax=Algimonas arctica TaxID=1479486 RepID=A0A8J3G1H4_9PROT|nr:hypothetical protein GCM10009069_06420 [Algimonas arctica]
MASPPTKGGIMGMNSGPRSIKADAIQKQLAENQPRPNNNPVQNPARAGLSRRDTPTRRMNSNVSERRVTPQR